MLILFRVITCCFSLSCLPLPDCAVPISVRTLQVLARYFFLEKDKCNQITIKRANVVQLFFLRKPYSFFPFHEVPQLRGMITGRNWVSTINVLMLENIFDEQILKRVKFLWLSHQATELPSSAFFQNCWIRLKDKMQSSISVGETTPLLIWRGFRVI